LAYITPEDTGVANEALQHSLVDHREAYASARQLCTQTVKQVIRTIGSEQEFESDLNLAGVITVRWKQVVVRPDGSDPKKANFECVARIRPGNLSLISLVQYEQRGSERRGVEILTNRDVRVFGDWSRQSAVSRNAALTKAANSYNAIEILAASNGTKLPDTVGFARLLADESIEQCHWIRMKGKIAQLNRQSNGVSVDGFALDVRGSREYINVDTSRLSPRAGEELIALFERGGMATVSAYRCGAAGRMVTLDDIVFARPEEK
jgi:hypothetical protein